MLPTVTRAAPPASAPAPMRNVRRLVGRDSAPMWSIMCAIPASMAGMPTSWWSWSRSRVIDRSSCSVPEKTSLRLLT